MDYFKLNNGVEMPALGYGVYQIESTECENCVSEAIRIGYRMIDTAQAYGNEESVGRAIKASGIDRKALFITTKIGVGNAGYEKAKRSIEDSLRKLQTDYIDLLLVHQPFGDYYGSYRAMVEAYHDGKVRAVGVSNFYPDRLVDLCLFQELQPTVNQVETHVFNQQKQAHEIMEKYGVLHEAWASFAENRRDLFNDQTLSAIGAKYGKTTAQVMLRYLLDRNIAVIPKTVRPEKMAENIDVFDFVLSADDALKIAAMDEEKSSFRSHRDPQTVELFANGITNRKTKG